MAKTSKVDSQVKVRVLVDCEYGQPDDVVTIDAALTASLVGIVDSSPEAVAYAESLQ